MDKRRQQIHVISPTRNRRLGNFETVALILLCSITLFLIPGCFNRRFYQPNQILYKTPDQYNLRHEEVFFKSRDGTKLHGWFIPAVGDAIGTVIHLHGNYGNLTYYLDQISWLPFNRFNVFTFDYRGYGRSEGTPSRQGVYEDSVSAIEHIISKPAMADSDIYILGQSLGGANAIAALAQNEFPEIRAIAVEGAFYSYRAEARDVMGATVQKKVGNIPFLSQQVWLVSYLSVTDSYSPDEFVAQVSPIPILLIHCVKDSLVSYHHSEWLYKKAKDPKHLWLVNVCGHLNLFTDHATEYGYRQKLVQFFNAHRRDLK